LQKRYRNDINNKVIKNTTNLKLWLGARFQCLLLFITNEMLIIDGKLKRIHVWIGIQNFNCAYKMISQIIQLNCKAQKNKKSA